MKFHRCEWCRRPLWSWSYGNWIYNYLCNQCLSPLMLRVRILIRARCTSLCDKVCQWVATVCGFLWVLQFNSTNKTDCYDVTEILLKVSLHTTKQTNKWMMHGENYLVIQYCFYIHQKVLDILKTYFYLRSSKPVSGTWSDTKFNVIKIFALKRQKIGYNTVSAILYTHCCKLYHHLKMM